MGCLVYHIMEAIGLPTSLLHYITLAMQTGPPLAIVHSMLLLLGTFVQMAGQEAMGQPSAMTKNITHATLLLPHIPIVMTALRNILYTIERLFICVNI